MIAKHLSADRRPDRIAAGHSAWGNEASPSSSLAPRTRQILGKRIATGQCARLPDAGKQRLPARPTDRLLNRQAGHPLKPNREQGDESARHGPADDSVPCSPSKEKEKAHRDGRPRWRAMTGSLRPPWNPARESLEPRACVAACSADLLLSARDVSLRLSESEPPWKNVGIGRSSH